MRIGTFNVEYGGKYGSFSDFISIINEADCDVLFLQENITETLAGNEDFGKKIFMATKYFYYLKFTSSYPVCVLSKNSISSFFKYNGKIKGITIEDIAFFCVHLEDIPCTYLTVQGYEYEKTPPSKNSVEAVLQSFNSKKEEFNKIIKFCNIEDIKNGSIVILGDFNEPSHLDPKWINFEWKCSKILEEEGFIDCGHAFKNFKNTCCNIKKKNFNEDPSWDRIDRIYIKNLNLVEYSVLPSKISDHYFVNIKIE